MNHINKVAIFLISLFLTFSSVTMVFAACGSANEDYFSNAPTSGFCSSGSFSGLSVCTVGVTNWRCDNGNLGGWVYGGWTWSCQESSGQINYCRAYKSVAILVNGVCGSKHQTTVSSGSLNSGSSGLCSIGPVSNFQIFNGNYWWKCEGSNGGLASDWCIAYISNPCTWSCGSWGACQSGNIQYRSCSSSPSGCTGSNPYATSQSCTYTPPSCTYSCGSWSGCSGSSHTQSRTCSANNTPCSGSTSYNEYAGCTPSCTYSCGSWSGCSGSSHTQSRTCSANNTPCSGSTSYNENTSCTPSCTYSYGSWSTCSVSTYTQTRTATANNTPCSGSTSFTQTQSCTPTINGECGTANGKTYAYNATGYAPDTQCAIGSSSNTAFPNPGSSVSWTCSGTNGGTTASCSASRNPTPVNGSCGSSNGTKGTTAPTTNLCAVGTASLVTGTGPWTWTCSGTNGGTTASCSATKAIDGLCGTSRNGIYSTAPSVNLCTSGASSSPVWNGTNWAWVCRSCDGGRAEFCYANRSIVPVCGTSHDKILSAAPTTNLCAIGTPSLVTGTGPWTWTCNNTSETILSYCGANNTGQSCYFCCR
ncbi:hypothetical protein M0R01_04675 [bacterium]|nr:hypothetical protein [bacterium]